MALTGADLHLLLKQLDLHTGLAQQPLLLPKHHPHMAQLEGLVAQLCLHLNQLREREREREGGKDPQLARE